MRRLLPLPGTELDDLWELYALPDAAHLRAGFVQSLDGAIAVRGSSTPLSGPADKQVFRTLRAVSDVVLVGAGTARAEDYGPIPLPDELRQRRTEEGRPELPVLAVVTRHTDHLDPGMRLFVDPSRPTLVLAADGLGVGYPEHVQVVIIDAGDPGGLLAALHAQGLRRVLCEGGPQLFGALLTAGLVDELCLTIAPQLIGARGLLPEQARPKKVSMRSLVESDGVLLTRWAIET